MHAMELLSASAVYYLLALALVSWAAVMIHHALSPKKNLPPFVPGIPILGNTLQIVEQPHLTLTSWAEKYGPIFGIKLGFVKSVVVTSPELVKEVLVTHYDSMSCKSLGASKRVLADHLIVSSDYNDKYVRMKRMLVSNVLSTNAQRSFRSLREKHLSKSVEDLFTELKTKNPDTCSGEVDVRFYIENVVFPYGMEQAFGREIKELYVPKLGTLNLWQMYDILVMEILRGSAIMDWRDLFPFLSWVPNRKLDNRIKMIADRRRMVMKALIEDQRKLLKAGKAPQNSYCTILLNQYEDELSSEELVMSLWDPIIAIADNTVVTAEWALHELAMQPHLQEHLYNEIERVVGRRMITESDLPNLPYLVATVKETLRKYHPVNVLLPRYVNSDFKLAGYDIPKGWNVLVNVHGIHFDKKIWSNPDVWDPSRIVNDDELDLGVNDMRLIPFSAGKRMCAGVTPALTLTPLIIGSLVQHFRWSLPAAATENVLYLTTHTIQHLRALATPRFEHVLGMN